jgi:squalene-associated FAD-dependent desaturase
VIVLGGGLAGITAALDCAGAGAQVTLLEVRPRLGGAAYSFERDGLWLDNGQHVFLRCCAAYRKLLARLGSESRVSIQPRLEIPVLSPGRKPVVLQRNRLPAPLHLAGALVRYSHLSLAQRLRAARAAFMLGRLDVGEASEQERLHNTTLGEWLAEHGQTPASVGALWDLIALPTLNLPASQGSLALGAFVLQTGLLARNNAGDIGFHMRPLSETIGDPAARVLGEAGVDVRLGVRAEGVESTVKSVVPSAGAVRLRAPARAGEGGPTEGLTVLANGVELEGDAVICAVPHERAGPLLGPLLGAEAESWSGLGASPIVNVHIVYDRRVCEMGFAAGVGTPVQYLFDRSAAAGLSNGQYLAVSLSGAAEEMKLSSEQLGARYVQAMRELLPRTREAQVHSLHVSREHAATFAARPGTQALRPSARTNVPGLVLAGAWTDTGWPATLEGAVLSGHAAARVALAA